MSDDKTLRIVHENVVKGEQQVLKALKDQTKAYRDLEETVKRTQKIFRDQLAVDRDIARQLAENIRLLQQYQRINNSIRVGPVPSGVRPGGAGGTTGVSGAPYPIQVQSGSTTWGPGGPPPNVTYNPYAGGRQPWNWGAIGGTMMKIGGGIAAAGGLINRGVNEYTGYQERMAHHDIHAKTQGLENLAGAQSYRNYKYNEALSAPTGYVAMKGAYRFNVRTSDSRPMHVDSRGRLLGGDEGPMRSEEGMSVPLRASDMRGESRLIEAQGTRGTGHMVAGGTMIAGGVAMLGGVAMGGLAGAAAGSLAGPLGMAAGGIGGAVMNAAGVAGGVSLITAGFKEALGGYFEEKSAAKRLNTGELSASQSEQAVKAERLVDELLAVKRTQLGIWQEIAPERAAMQRQTLGLFADTATSWGISGAERAAAIHGGLRAFGARGGQVGMAVAGRLGTGMSAGAMTQIMGMGASTGAGGRETLERTIAAGFNQGWKALDMVFFEKIGAAFADSLETQSMGRSGGSNIDFAYSGLGPGVTAGQVEARRRASGIESDIFRGNAYFQSQAFLQAGNILGGDASGVEIGALGKASLADLLAEHPEKLEALGITASQRQAAAQQRIAGFGAVMSGHKGVGAMISGAGGFQQLLQQLASEIEGSQPGSTNRKSAEQRLSTIAAVASEVLGEEDFMGLQQMLAKMGFRGGSVDAFMAKGGRRRMPGRVGAKEALAMDASSQARQKEGMRGKKHLANPEDIRKKIEELEQYESDDEGNDVLKPHERQHLQTLRDFEAGRAGVHAAGMAMEALTRNENANIASGADGYGSAQKMLGILNTDIETLDKQVKRLTDILRTAEPAFRKVGGRGG